MGNSSRHKDWPLTLRSDGRWQKKVRGKRYYFGTDADAALAEWTRVKEFRLAGNEPPATDAPPADDEGMQVGELCDRFLQAKAVQRDSGELSPMTWNDYKRTCDRMVAHFGKAKPVAKLTAADFTSLKGASRKRAASSASETKSSGCGLLQLGCGRRYYRASPVRQAVQATWQKANANAPREAECGPWQKAVFGG